MVADLLSLALMLFGLVTGVYTGTVPAAVRLGVVVFSGLLAWLIGPHMAVFWQGKSQGTAETAVVWSYLIVFAVFVAVLTFGARGLTQATTDVERRPAPLDRVGGALVGLLRGAALAYLLVASGLTLFAGNGSPNLGWADSTAAEVVIQRNLHDGGVARVEDEMDVKQDAAENAVDRYL